MVSPGPEGQHPAGPEPAPPDATVVIHRVPQSPGPGSATTAAAGTGDATMIIGQVAPPPAPTAPAGGAPLPDAGPRPSNGRGGRETGRHRRSRSGNGRARQGDGGARHRSAVDSGDADGTDQPNPRGEIVVQLRPVRTREGYRSVYSELTRMTFRNVVLTASRVTGELLITFGVIVLLFASYEVWGVGAKVDAHQNDLNDRLAQDWGAAPSPTVSASASPTPAPPPMGGSGLARMYIPRIKDKPWVVVQGVGEADIKYAPGHYPSTAMPGQIGNFSVAGHRTPAIFWDLDQVRAGDPVVVETRDTWFVYTVTQLHIVSPQATEVVAAVPNRPGVAPTTAMLTITTCNPKWDNYERLVLHARLARQQPHDAGYPPELGR